MKSSKGEGGIFKKIRHAYLRFMYTKESVEKIENAPAVPFKEKLKEHWYDWIVLPIICIVLIVTFYTIQGMKEKERLEKYKGEYYHSEITGDKAQIETKNLDNLFTNELDGKVVKMAYSTLNGEVSYSLTYAIDDNLTGDMYTSKYFTSGEIVAIFLNGYPKVDYKEMGLDSKEDAYIATQLAVYHLVDSKNYSMKNGNFSIDKLKPINSKDEKRCQQIIAKAKELYDYAISNPYEIETGVEVNGLNEELSLVDGGVLAGPFTFETYTDENTKLILGDMYNDDISVNVNSYVDNTYAEFLNENKEEIKSISSGDTFYIKINSENKVFSVVDVLAHTNYLRSRIYSQENTDKKYVALDKMDLSYAENFSIIYGIDFGYTNVSFITGKDKIVSDVYFRIYDEEGTLIEDCDGYATEYEFALPVGKYTIELYKTPKGYFFKDTNLDFEITKGEINNLVITADSLEGRN